MIDPNPSSDRPAGARLSRQLPVAFLYIQGPDLASRPWDPLARKLVEHLPSLRPLSRNLLYCRHPPHRPDLFDAALETALELRGLPPAVLPALDQLRVLVFPGEIRVRDGAAEPVSEPLADELRELPQLPIDPGIFVTSRVAQSMERFWELTPGGKYSCRAGLVLPLHQVTGGSEPTDRPYRNLEILGRRIPFVERPALGAQLNTALSQGGARLYGPIGSGKSRLVHQHVTGTFDSVAWINPGSSSRSLAEIALRTLLAVTHNPSRETVLARVGDAVPDDRAEVATTLLLQIVDAFAKHRSERLALVFDDLHQAAPEELSVIGRLLAAGLPGGRIALLAIGRSAGPWESACGPLGELEVPPLAEEAIRRLADELCGTLEMPAGVVDRFLSRSAGSPFCFEEGLIELIHQRSLRQVYGSFFFGGPPTTTYTPSWRLVSHALAEADRLAGGEALLVLAAVDHGLPVAVVDSVAAALGGSPPAEWTTRGVLAGWLEPAATPWGDGVHLFHPAMASSLRRSLPAEQARLVRRLVGRQLNELDGGADGKLAAATLMGGSVAGARALLSTFDPLPPEALRDEIFMALRTELDALRRRGDEPDLEADLLWALLPLARRVGRLSEVDHELDRALAITAEDAGKSLAFLTLRADIDVDEGRPREAEAHLRRALELAVAKGIRRKNLLAIQLCRLLIHEERFDEAEELLQRLLVNPDEPLTAAATATCHFYLGNIALHRGRYDDAMDLHRKALAAREGMKAASAIGASLCALGATYRQMGNYPEAQELFERALGHLEAHGRPGEASYALSGLGIVLSRLGQYTAATRPLREALAQRTTIGAAMGEALARLAVAENYLDLERHADATDEARRALFQIDMLEQSPIRGDAAQLLGRILLKQRRNDEARKHLREALADHLAHDRQREAISDRGWLLVDAMARDERHEVERLAGEMEAALDRGPYPERGELEDYRLFEALEWIQKKGGTAPADPIRFLRRAYRELMRKTAYLPPEQRTPYLLQIPDHAPIVNAATRHRLSLPDGW